jgi:hypothetical protein
MKFYQFSFRNEAIWSMAFTLVGLALGVIALLVVYLARHR